MNNSSSKVQWPVGGGREVCLVTNGMNAEGNSAPNALWELIRLFVCLYC